MQRITDANLQAVVDRINRETGMPMKSYDTPKNEAEKLMYSGSQVPQAGNYHLSWAYGGVSLHRMSLTPGCTGISDVFSIGHVTKRELYNHMHAFLRGLDAAKQ
jgi:hypothetical protein